MDNYEHNDYIDEIYGRFAAVLQMKDLHLVDDPGLIFISTKGLVRTDNNSKE